MKNTLLILCAALLLIIGKNCRAEEEKGVFTFAISLSLTGEFSESGNKALAGVKLRVDDYNENVKPGQPTLQYVAMDDKSQKEQAQENVKRCAQENIPVIIGPLASMLVMGMREIAQKEHIVIISPTVTSPLVGRNHDWVCRMLFDDEFQGTALARYLAGTRGMTRVAAFINDRLFYASSVYNAFKQEFERLGGEMVHTEHYEWIADEFEVYDFSEALKKIKDARPDIVLLPVNSTEVAAIIGQSTRLGLGLTFCGGDTWLNELVLLASGNDVEHAYYVSGINFQSGTPEMEHYNYLYDHSNDPMIQQTSVMGYDAASLMIEALKNGLDAESIRNTLYTIKDFHLATGTITVDPERGSEKTAFISRIEYKGDQFVARVVDEVEP